MKNFGEIIKLIIDRLQRRKAWLIALSAVVVFVTTYALILPAITLEQSRAVRQGGIDLPGTGAIEATEQDAHTEDVKNDSEKAAVNGGADIASDNNRGTSDGAGKDSSKNSGSHSEANASGNAGSDAASAKDGDKAQRDSATKASADPVSLTYECDDYTVAVEGKAAGLTNDMSVEVSEIDKADKKQKKEYKALYEDALKAVQDEKDGENVTDFAFAKFYDISIKDGDETVEPGDSVDVKISYEKELRKELAAADPDKVRIIHFAEDKETGEITPQVLAADDTDITLRHEQVAEAAFTTDSFSVYGVVYTVDFHYTVDGKTFDFSIPGGGSVSLSELIEVLGIAGDGKGEETWDFIKDVEKVEFSDPELVWVGKVGSKSTVGELKKAKDLDVEYSEDLTEEQIEEINARTIEAGDWALISKKPFDTEETLTVTMNDGEVFAIKVTDEQPNNPYGLGGKTFVIANRKNNTNSALTASVSSSNNACLAGTNLQNVTNAPNNIRWTFEYTGTGTEFLVHDQSGRYLIINEGNITLGTREQAEENPTVVEYNNSNDRYALKAKNNDQALNNYGGSGYGRWTFNAGNDDFWMQLLDPSNIGKPGTISTADTRAEGITINLFDYGPDSLDAEGNKVGSIVNDGINKNHDLKFVSHGTEGDSMNHYTGGTNEGGSTGTRYRAMQGIVKPGLVNGYPVLTGYSTEQGSLQYLFDPSTTVDGKTSYADVNHLFTKDENGYYQYDSNLNYAYYDTSNANTNRDFKVYANSFDEEGTVRNEKVGFFPFNDYNSYYNCIHGGTAGDQWNGFKSYGPHKGNYSDKLGHYNHHFGMSMTAEFVMTPDGKVNGRDMEFSFSGDDDMWVFVDGVLVLDIGGIHNPVSGSINFRTGDVTVSGAKTVNSTGALAGPTSLTQAFSRVAGKDWNSTPFSTHKLEVFYLERGGMYSNCKIGFNLPTYKTLSLSKHLTGLTPTELEKYKKEEFTYEVVVNNQLYNGSDTVRFNAAGEVIEAGFLIVNGQVKIKHGETVTITGLNRTDTFYAAEEKSLNMDIFEEPHAERNYYDSDEVKHEEEITLTKSHAEGVDLDDWKTPTYKLENTEKVTFTNTLKEKNLEVEKKWEGDKDHPNQVKFTVSAEIEGENGERVPYAVSVLKDEDGTTDKEFTLVDTENWRIEIEHLPAYTPDGKFIYYDIHEKKVEGYVSNAQDITAEEYHYCDVDVVKYWPDEGPHDENITIRLKNKAGQYYAGVDEKGEAKFRGFSEAKPIVLNQGNSFTYRFERVPVDEEYTVEKDGAQTGTATDLVTYVRNIIQYQLVNTPIGEEVGPGGNEENPEIHKRIDALRDKVNNKDTTIDDPDNDGQYPDDLVDLYRLYLDYKINSLQEPEGVDLLFIIDHSGSMNNDEYSGNRFRAPAVMQALNGENGLVAEFLQMNENNRWAAVDFAGPSGLNYRIPVMWPPFYRETDYRSPNAGDTDSDVMSYWGNSAADIELANYGATMLTDYTAGLWRAEQLLFDENIMNDGKKKVVVFLSDGIPTLYIDCNGTLEGADRIEGSSYYPDPEGCPDQTLVQVGNFRNDIVTKTDNEGKPAYEFGKNIEFYTIGFGDSMMTEHGSSLLKNMLKTIYADDKHEGNFMTISDTPNSQWDEGYGDTTASVDKLKENLRTIMGMNEKFTKIVIQDDLSTYVDLYGFTAETTEAADIMRAAKAKVTMTIPDPTEDDPSHTSIVTLYTNGAPANSDDAKFTKSDDTVATIINRLEYDPSTKTVKAVFDPEYEAVQGVTYTLSFDVKTTQTAYETYENSGYDKTSNEPGAPVIEGDPDTDYKGTDPVNDTSSGKEGFRSNDEAKATYKHNDKDESKEYPHPVIQVFEAPIEFIKTDQSEKALAGAKFNLYNDQYDPAKAWNDAANVDCKINEEELVSETETVQNEEGGTTTKAVITTTTLRPGTYYLVETKAPEGYEGKGPIKIVVSVERTTDSGGGVTEAVNITATQGDTALTKFLTKPSEGNDNWVLKVQNSAGVELPFTGGIGTTRFIIIGSLLVIGCAAILIARRRTQSARR